MNVAYFEEIKKIDHQNAKIGKGISAFIDAAKLIDQAQKQQLEQPLTQRTQSKIYRKFDDDKPSAINNIMDYIKERAFVKESDWNNFKSKEVIADITEENFKNSVFVATLGKMKTWRPVKDHVMSGRQKKIIFNMINMKQ